MAKMLKEEIKELEECERMPNLWERNVDTVSRPGLEFGVCH
jgi:hypothetical protein